MADVLAPNYQGQLPFVLNLKHGIGARKFERFDELREWVSVQLQLIGPIASISPQSNDEPLYSTWNRCSGVNECVVFLQRTESMFSANDANWLQSFASVRSWLTDAYETFGFIVVESIEGAKLKEIAAVDAKAAWAALWCLSEGPLQGHILQLREPAIARGVGFAANIRYEMDQSALDKSAADAVNELLSRVSREAAEILSKSNAALELIKRVEDLAKAAWSSHEEQSKQIRTKLGEEVAEALKSAAADIEAFKSGYEQKIALQEPANFWQKKQTNHKNAARYFGIGSLGLGTVIGTIALFKFPSLLEVAKGSTTPTPGAIAITIVLTTLGLWILRVLVRQYFSQQHLSTDAAERVVMVKTYLSLLEAKSAPVEHIAPVLTALFRSANDGIVKDDSMPPVLAEFLTKVKP